jgi:predicted metalloprotease with PDZ domain
MLHSMKSLHLPSLLLALSLLGPSPVPAATPASAGASSVPNALDAPYPGVIRLSVDLRDTQQRIFKVHESIPVQPGPVMLLYPKWIPGEHGPTGPIDSVVGLRISGAGKALQWRRDLRELYGVRFVVPPDVHAIDVDFQVLSASRAGLFGQGVAVTNHIADLAFNQVVFYPAGHYATQITVQADVTLPPRWPFATSLETRPGTTDNGPVHFAPVSLDTLVDSPLICGEYFQRVTLEAGQPGQPPVYLNMVADRPENLLATAAQFDDLRALVRQAGMLFGAHHYRHYDFLLTLSDHTAHFGLEHHQSSEDRVSADYFTDTDSFIDNASLMPHEYVHSWNGKFRRPTDLAVPIYDQAMQTDLLWVYEGLTNYWGDVLAARSGLISPELFRGYMAWLADYLSHIPGRSWRPLQDTANEAALAYLLPRDWQSWRRGTDFYEEGDMLWLDVDTKIRELSHDSRSLDDFAHAFHGIHDGDVGVLGYQFADIVAALQSVQPYDWAGLLHAHLDATEAATLLDGLKRGGWQLEYGEMPQPYFAAYEADNKVVDLMASIGVLVDDESLDDPEEGHAPGKLQDVLWQGPAFNAGLAPGMIIVAVNGDKYSAGVLKGAVQASRNAAQPLQLLLLNDDSYTTVTIDYHGGSRYPYLKRIEGIPDRLSDLARAR